LIFDIDLVYTLFIVDKFPKPFSFGGTINSFIMLKKFFFKLLV